MKNCLAFCKQEVVLLLCALGALLSMLAVPPDAGYAAYIDVRVLVLLSCLMAVVGSAKEQGIFQRLCRSLLRCAGNTRSAALISILLPFFCSMLVTNDVALITFVPLALAVLRTCAPEQVIFVVVMQTIAANLGSTLTPVGNPQNLYLSAFYGFSLPEFCAIVAPLAVAGLILILSTSLLRLSPAPIAPPEPQEEPPLQLARLFLCAGLFVVCVLSVLRVVDYRLTLVIVAVSLALFHRQAFRHVDISLLATFLCLFIFVGNLARIDAVRTLLASWIDGRALLVSALASQAISNVPAALMLSGFTTDGRGLLLGVNLGGLGTPIASMASLISLRLYSRLPHARTKRYLLCFSLYNFFFLALLLAAYTWLGSLPTA